jgi:hypothetical protein
MRGATMGGGVLRAAKITLARQYGRCNAAGVS